jgi:hypothetical protein
MAAQKSSDNTNLHSNSSNIPPGMTSGKLKEHKKGGAKVGGIGGANAIVDEE